MPKRRILEKIVLTEISGVDRPCQEGAMVTIMKRADDEADTSALTARVNKAEEQINEAAAQSFLAELEKLEAELDALINGVEIKTTRHRDVMNRVEAVLGKYSPSQPRDKDGKWTDGGSGGMLARMRASNAASRETYRRNVELESKRPSKATAHDSPKQFLRKAVRELLKGAVTGFAYSALAGGLGAVLVGGAAAGVPALGRAAMSAGVQGAITTTAFNSALIAVAGAGLVTRAIIAARKNRIGKAASTNVEEDIKDLSPAELRAFYRIVIDMLSDEQAAQLAGKLGMNAKPVKKAWSVAAREAAARARRRGGSKRSRSWWTTLSPKRKKKLRFFNFAGVLKRAEEALQSLDNKPAGGVPATAPE